MRKRRFRETSVAAAVKNGIDARVNIFSQTLERAVNASHLSTGFLKSNFSSDSEHSLSRVIRGNFRKPSCEGGEITRSPAKNISNTSEFFINALSEIAI